MISRARGRNAKKRLTRQEREEIFDPSQIPHSFKKWMRDWLGLNPPRISLTDTTMIAAGDEGRVETIPRGLFVYGPDGETVVAKFPTDGSGIFLNAQLFVEQGITATDADDTVIFSVDPVTGNVYARGTLAAFNNLEWGTASRLTAADIIEIAQQTAAAFETVTHVQASATGQDAGSGNTFSNFSRTLSSTSEDGNLLLISVFQQHGSNVPSAPTTPAGYTLEFDDSRAVGGGGVRLTVYSRKDAPETDSVTVTFGGANKPRRVVMALQEYSGAERVATVLDVENNSEGLVTGDGAWDVPDTATTNQTHERHIGVLLSFSNRGHDASITGSDWDLEVQSVSDIEAKSLDDLLYGRVWSRPLTATGVQAFEGAFDGGPSQDINWIGWHGTFKARAAGVDVPPVGVVNVYAVENDGESRLAYKSDSDKEYLLGIERAVNTSQLDVGTSSAAEHSLFSSRLVIANEAGAIYRVRVSGTYNQSSAAGGLTIRLKAGSTTLVSATVGAPGANNSGQNFEFEGFVVIRNPGASASLAGNLARYAQSAGTIYTVNGFAGTSVDLTSAKEIDVTIQFAGSNVNNKVLVEIALAERVG